MPLKSKATLIVFSGLPASGKTTLASKLAAHLQVTYVRIDAITVGLKEEVKNPDLPEKCYRVARSLALENLRLGSSVITDSVNPYVQIREDWENVAKAVGAKAVHVEIICSDKEEHQMRLKSRTTTLAGLTDPTWQEVQEREYHIWDQDRILLETSGKTVEATFDELLSVLKSKISLSKL